MEYRRLGRSGIRVSVIGFGSSPLGNEFHVIDPADGERAVHHAVDCGINFFDVSPYYGRTLAEERLGSFLSGRRDKVVVATKCGRYDVNRFDFSAARVMESAEESIKRLRTDYLDVLYAHDIEFGDREQIVNETIPALRKLQQQGKARLIGVTGLPLELLGDVAVRGNVDVVMSYCRYNLLIRDLDTYLTHVLEPRGIALVNASPLHMGILTERGAPAWHPAPQQVKDAGKGIVDLLNVRGVAAAEVALRFCLDHAYVSSTLVGMSHPDQVDANLKTLGMHTDPRLLAEIEETAGPALNATWPSGRPENSDKSVKQK
jgi:L-galactose dehydrogenase